jgi:hypothetical protein
MTHRLEGANYVILDAARMGSHLAEASRRQPSHVCLYLGASQFHLGGVAPYLFSVSRGDDFTEWLFKEGWGRSWGIYLNASSDFEKVRVHLRKFLIVGREHGHELYFRYYDPRALRVVLPEMNPEQLRVFFGPVEEYLLEDENPSFVIRYRLDEQGLRAVRESTTR